MKKGTILIYIITNKICLFHTKTKREVIAEVDTSLFFKCGEIKDVSELTTQFNKVFIKHKFLTGIAKDNINILYNNISNSDTESLYKAALEPLDCGKITFTKIEDVASGLNNSAKIVYFDGKTYTSFNLKKKSEDINDFPSDSIFVGSCNSKIHYSRKNIVWELYKSRFTK